MSDADAEVSLVALVPVAKQHARRNRFFRGYEFADKSLLDALGKLSGIVRDNSEFDSEICAIDTKRIADIGQHSIA